MKFLVKSIRENEKVAIEKVNKKRETKLIGLENKNEEIIKEIKKNDHFDLIDIENGVGSKEDITTS